MNIRYRLASSSSQKWTRDDDADADARSEAGRGGDSSVCLQSMCASVQSISNATRISGLVREGWNKIIQLQVYFKRGDSSTFTPSYLMRPNSNLELLGRMVMIAA